jgi:hypothetical protein
MPMLEVARRLPDTLARLALGVVLAVALLPAGPTVAPAQTGTATSETERRPPFGITRDGQLLVKGAACQRRTDAARGVIRRDFCDRWYCGRADTPDLSEVIPDWGNRHGCRWQLVASLCRCLRPDGTEPASAHRR